MTFRKLWYMGLEPYQGRYTLQLQRWNTDEFKRLGVNYTCVSGDTLDSSQAIVTGQVLDAHGRSYFSMSQMMNLVKEMRNGHVTNEDVIFFEDMFQPGIESLPYIMNQVPEKMRPKVFVRCLAQTIDPDDFVNVWGMYPWMNNYEKMVSEFVDGVLVASEEMVANIKVAGWEAPCYVTGLPFGKGEVLSWVERIKPFEYRPMRVGFAARWDQEKQPDFYMDLIELVTKNDPTIEFAIYSGGRLRSNDQKYIDRARKLEANGKLKIFENLSKKEYYNELNNTRVLFNCALQDWVSNTVSEADTLGSNVLYPAYRSFPETFANDHTRLYVPWSLDDAYNKLVGLLYAPHKNMGKISDYQDKTIERTINVFNGDCSGLRSDFRYRNNVAKAKF